MDKTYGGYTLEQLGDFYSCGDDAPLIVRELAAYIKELEAANAELKKYAAPTDAVALSHVKNPCQKHNQYWTTAYGACMACRAEDAEAANATLTAEREKNLRRIGTLEMHYEQNAETACMMFAAMKSAGFLGTEMVGPNDCAGAVFIRGLAAERDGAIAERDARVVLPEIPLGKQLYVVRRDDGTYYAEIQPYRVSGACEWENGPTPSAALEALRKKMENTHA